MQREYRASSSQTPTTLGATLDPADIFPSWTQEKSKSQHRDHSTWGKFSSWPWWLHLTVPLHMLILPTFCLCLSTVEIPHSHEVTAELWSPLRSLTLFDPFLSQTCTVISESLGSVFLPLLHSGRVRAATVWGRLSSLFPSCAFSMVLMPASGRTELSHI